MALVVTQDATVVVRAPFFWSALEAIMPDYHEAKRWLKDNGHVLRV